MNNKITVIIPTYNSSSYIECCINSILNQTYQNFEIIVIDDGSLDNTIEVVKGIKNNKIKIIELDNNHGQGYARNLALKYATGDYVMFLDSDDFIESVTFEVALKRILEDKSDFVYFDWKYYKESNERYQYVSKEEFFDKKYLENNECKQLLKIQHYFTVNKLYDRRFLIDNNILYGEHYIYEDVIFWVRVVMNARKVSIIHSPLYNVRINRASTTKTNYNTNKHVYGFLKAFDEGIQLFDNGSMEKYWFLNYMFKKFLLYYSSRTPKRLKKYFASEFYMRIYKYNINMLLSRTRYNRLAISMKIFASISRFGLFLSMYGMKKYYKRSIAFGKKIKSKIKTIFKKNINLECYKSTKDRLKKQILFMGFDYRYTGSSRYLFEEMLKNKTDDVYFVTEEELVDADKRIIPNSLEFYEKLYSSKIVIFESWIPNKIYKPKDAIWINLWHGTPLKKMLFDSNEEEIIKVKPNHKKEKFNAISKIDYLLTDNEYVKKYFKTSFLIPDSKILSYGYPRVKFLLENKNNELLKESIRKKLNISNYKKIVLYLPTWRDYNYNVDDDECDFSYLLDREKLMSFLGSEYVVVSKDHAFLRKAKDVTLTDIETQELLLVSDYVVSDYSSVMFDAFALDIPVCLIVKDYEKYSQSRGVYSDIWNDLEPFAVKDEEMLAMLIKDYCFVNELKKVKEKYCYRSCGNLIEFIDEKLK